MRMLSGVALLAVAFSVSAEPRIYPPKKIGDYIVQTTEINSNRHNTWLVRVEDPARGVVCYMQLGEQISCVPMTRAPVAAEASPPAARVPAQKEK